MNTWISVFDLFKIGIGPSSSHTVGPMKAARHFVQTLKNDSILSSVDKINLSLYGSLALTGIGHGTDKALILGLLGEEPSTIDPETIEEKVLNVKNHGQILLLGFHKISFDSKNDLLWYRTENLPTHPNGMRFEAFDGHGQRLKEAYAYSVGGGFITWEGESGSTASPTEIPYPYRTGAELLELGQKHSMKFWQIVLENEKNFRSEKEIREGVLQIWDVMKKCVQRGFRQNGILPGGMKVRRRAPALYQELQGREIGKDPLAILDWVNAFALAVNEENAAFGKVVTAPTNGAAGIIPACLHYYAQFVPNADDEGIFRFFLTATALGTLYKLNASLSGAEVGCQGEVGVASSLAAGALTEVLGGTNEQIENAAEIAMEHHLGMTCDPVGGLVQIPCIERNAMGAVKAINASRIALKGNGIHAISLDRVIKTMWETGQDMSTKYKETSRGGLAVNVPEC